MGDQEKMEQASGRPTLVTVLCILSFLGSGLSALFLLLIVIGGATLASKLPEAFSGMFAASGGMTFLIATLVLSVASLLGAIKMWGMKKLGFFLYAGANIVGIILPLAFGMGFSIFGAVITLGFIGGYYTQFKNMT